MQILTEADFMAEVNDLIMYVTGLPKEKVFRGNQSREVLPKDNIFCIYTPITRTRIGTNVAELHAENVLPQNNAPEVDTCLVKVDLQIDFYGHTASRYAQAFETFSRAYRCNQWLQQSKMGIRVLHASDPMDGTMISDTRQYIPRWIVTLSINFESAVSDDIPWIEDATVLPNPVDPDGLVSGVKLKNIDIMYK